MKYATVKIDDFDIPLIGIDPAETQEQCDNCDSIKHLKEIDFSGKFKCIECLKLGS